MDGVDSYYEFIVPPESIENKYIHRNYEARDQNEYLTFHIPLSFFCCVSLSPFLSLSLSLSGARTAAGYMKTIHHCIFTIKLLTEDEGGLYWLRFTRLDKEKSHPIVKHENLNKKITKANHVFHLMRCSAEKGEHRKVRHGVSAATNNPEQPNKVIKERPPFAHERSTLKPHLFPLPRSLHIAVSIC